MQPHRLPVTVYLEDTDAQGIVYHANYLKYCERARTDLLKSLGAGLRELHEQGWTFVVHEIQIKFHKSARLDDILEVQTTMERATSYRATFHQKIFRSPETQPLIRARAEVVTIGPDGGLKHLPDAIFE